MFVDLNAWAATNAPSDARHRGYWRGVVTPV